jgi:hypothetical protein
MKRPEGARPQGPPVSPWEVRIGDVFVIGAVGPEAQKDKAGFERAVSAAKARLAEVEP